MLPCATNATRTGKNAPTSSPPTLNSSVPERACASTRPTSQSIAWLDELSAHSPVCEETVGYEPSLWVQGQVVLRWRRGGTDGRGMEMTTSCRTTPSFSSSYSMLTSHVPSLDGVGQQLTAKQRERQNQH